MLIRKDYLAWMHQQRRSPFAKVLTGLRRVGKSTLLQQFETTLLEEGLPRQNILLVDIEQLAFRHIHSAADLDKAVKAGFDGIQGERFLLVDEVQEIQGWEHAIASLLKEGGIDIYLTGSNAQLLSSDLATYLAGRYVQKDVYSFSYAEYLAFKGETRHSSALFRSYIKHGGFPGIQYLPDDDTLRFQALNDLYSSIILRDVVERYKVRNVALLERLILFFFDNIGQPVSARSITAYLKSQRLQVSTETILSYIGYLESCHALYRTSRYDIKGKRHLEINEKHYLGDLGLRHAILGEREGDIAQILENLVFLELKRRGYAVSTGLLDGYEVDFVAEKHEQRLYIQVSLLLASPETREREFRPLRSIPDAWPKIVLSMDELTRDEAGIRHRYLPDFLLAPQAAGDTW